MEEVQYHLLTNNGVRVKTLLLDKEHMNYLNITVLYKILLFLPFLCSPTQKKKGKTSTTQQQMKKQTNNTSYILCHLSNCACGMHNDIV